MPGVSQIIFSALKLSPDLVRDKRVIDIGSCDFNGSIRPLLESWNPGEYVGVDIIAGKCVDVVCNADDLISTFGKESFDIALCLEMLEHTPHWKRSISNIKNIIKEDGLLLLTTRSLGYPCHGYPNDYWRYEIEDIRIMFDDFEILDLRSDPLNPGVFLFARKKKGFAETDLTSTLLYSMLTNRKEMTFSESFYKDPYCKKLALKQKIKSLANDLFLLAGRITNKILHIR